MSLSADSLFPQVSTFVAMKPLSLCRQMPFSSSNSPVEAVSAENTLTKSKIKRRFTFTKGKSSSKSRRSNSEIGTPGMEFTSMLFRRRKESTPTPKAVTLLSKRDSSDESSVTSGLNWSIPYDLPGAVEGRMDKGSMENMMFDADEIRARCRSTPTIAERRESDSTISISDMRMTQNGPMTADVAVQVNTDESIFQFPDTAAEIVASPGRAYGHQGLHNGGSTPRGLHSSPNERRSQRARAGGSQRRREHQSEEGRGVQSSDSHVHQQSRTVRTHRSHKRLIHVGSSPQMATEHHRAQHHNSRERWKDDDVSVCKMNLY